MSLRESILSADDIKYDTVQVDEWNEEVRVKSLSAGDTESLQRYQDKNKDRPNQNHLGYLASLVIVDEEGKRIFDKPGDAALLGAKSIVALTTVLNAAAALNGELHTLVLDEATAAKN